MDEKTMLERLGSGPTDVVTIKWSPLKVEPLKRYYLKWGLIIKQVPT